MSKKIHLFPAGFVQYLNGMFKKNIKIFFVFMVYCLFGSYLYASTNVYISYVSVHKDNGSDCIVPLGGVPSTDVSGPQGASSFLWGNGAGLIEFDRPGTLPTAPIVAPNYPGACLSLCAEVKCTNLGNPLNPLGNPIDFPIEFMRFEVFKFLPGTNPLNASSAPSLRTIYIYNAGICPADADPITAGIQDVKDYTIGTFCTAWDGSYNIDGVTDWGKTNGNFGFRATVNVNWVTQSQGSINVTMTSAYPGKDQFPVRVDVVNVHSLTVAPTVVGQITGVAARPYNIQYRLSKDALTTVTIHPSNANPATGAGVIKTIVNELPRTGEGIPNGTTTNGDAWDGTDAIGDLLPAGDYMVRIESHSDDVFGDDISQVKYTFIALDPLKVTDIRTTDLGPSSTDAAEITYVLTEPATVYVRIYPPGTTFTNLNTAPPTGASNPYLRQFVEQKAARTDVITLWDGRDTAGNPVADGDYVYAIYAEMPGSGGTIRTQRTYTGIIPVRRGFVITSPIAPSSTAIGQNPTAGGLDPFIFEYTLSRESPVIVEILDKTGTTLVKTLVDNETRPANFKNTETWYGFNNEGFRVGPGEYLVELKALDPLSPDPNNLARSTAFFPVKLFRVVDLQVTDLLGGPADQAVISFTMSQDMAVDLNIYDVGTVVDTSTWTSTSLPTIIGSPTPIKTLSDSSVDILPGRSVISQFWDGLREDSFDDMVPDGEYVYVLTAKSQAPVAKYPDTNGLTDGYADFDLISPYYATDKTTGTVGVSRGKVFLQNISVTSTQPETTSGQVVLTAPHTINFEVTRISSVDINIISPIHCSTEPDFICRKLVDDEVYQANQQYKVLWDGRDNLGNILPRGDYTIQVIASDYPDPTLHEPTTFQTAIEHRPYIVYDLQITDITAEQNEGIFSYILTEGMKKAIQIFKTGTQLDASGDPIPPVDESLVIALVGHRPGTLRINDIWNGADRSGTPVPDGNYPFRIVTVTDDLAMDNITGEVIGGLGNVADLDAYFTLQYISVDRGKSSDICRDFEQTVKIFPSPVTGNEATVWMTKLPTPGYYDMTIYNIARDRIYKHDWGFLAPSAQYPNLEFIWPLTNSSGRKVARGVYFVVFELKDADGSKQVCQTVKKILIP